MIDLHFVNQFMYENFERVTVSESGSHFHARCPLCGDSKKSLSKKRFHLDWSPARAVWQCWNCSRKGNFLQLFAEIKGISNSEAYKNLHKYDHDSFIQSLGKRNGEVGHTKLKKSDKVHNDILDDCVGGDLSLLVESVLLPTWEKTLSNFRIDREVPTKYPIYFAYKGKFKNRLIIPILDKDNIIYFQGRRIPGSSITPKYLNPATEKSLIIHNEDGFDANKYIVVTEGLLDAFSVGDQGTPCLGKEISGEFLDLLFQKTDLGVIIAFDNDEDGMKSLRKFMFGDWPKKHNKYSKRVKYFLIPEEFLKYKDINKLQCKEKISDVYNFIVENSYDYMQTTLKLNLEER